jgi:D-arabinose 5-phosphate isomerase GutQ
MSYDLDPDDLVSRARAIIHREARAVQLLGQQVDEGLADLLQMILDCRGHVLVTGAGTSRTVAERFAHLLSCCGTPALFIHAADCLHGGSGAITANDVLFAISKGGRSAEINQLAEIARACGARIIAQTEDPSAPLARLSDVVYRVAAQGDVDPYGMIATGSSLVNAAAGDILCVLLLEMRGYTRDEFGRTHPGGAVGRRRAAEERGTDAPA